MIICLESNTFNQNIVIQKKCYSKFLRPGCTGAVDSIICPIKSKDVRKNKTKVHLRSGKMNGEKEVGLSLGSSYVWKLVKVTTSPSISAIP